MVFGVIPDIPFNWLLVYSGVIVNIPFTAVNCVSFCVISYFMGLQAIDFDPTDATLLSNRSLCWIRLGQAAHALADAKACRALKLDWPKACYREGTALRLLQAFSPLYFCLFKHLLQ